MANLKRPWPSDRFQKTRTHPFDPQETFSERTKNKNGNPLAAVIVSKKVY